MYATTPEPASRLWGSLRPAVRALPAAFDRIAWLPTSLPGSALTLELYPLFAIAPMFVWDLVRTRKVHRAYMIWVLVSLPAAILGHTLWDSEWWHATARQLVGV